MAGLCNKFIFKVIKFESKVKFESNLLKAIAICFEQFANQYYSAGRKKTSSLTLKLFQQNISDHSHHKTNRL